MKTNDMGCPHRQHELHHARPTLAAVTASSDGLSAAYRCPREDARMTLLDENQPLERRDDYDTVLNLR